MLSKEEMDRLYEEEGAAQLTTSIVTFEEEGQTVVGRVKDISVFDGGSFDVEVMKYTLQGEGGTFTCVLGAAADKQLSKVGKLVGRVLAIRYKGKKSLKDGRHVNDFDIRDVTELLKARKDGKG